MATITPVQLFGISDVLTTNWGLTGAASHFDAVNDPVGSPDDASSFITADVNTFNSILRLRTDILVDPLTRLPSAWRFKMRYRASGFTVSRLMFLRLENNPDLAQVASASFVVSAALSDNTWRDANISAAVVNPDAATNKNAQNLMVQFLILTASERFDISQLYLETPNLNRLQIATPTGRAPMGVPS